MASAADLLASLPARPNRDKRVDAGEAVRLIRDGDAVVVGGFIGAHFAEERTLALEERFLATGAPRGLTLVFPVAAGDLKSRGLDRLAHPGLVRRAIGGHWAAAPALQKLAVEGEIEGDHAHLHRTRRHGRLHAGRARRQRALLRGRDALHDQLVHAPQARPCARQPRRRAAHHETLQEATRSLRWPTHGSWFTPPCTVDVNRRAYRAIARALARPELEG
jgi:hypothetical protein